MNSSTRNYLRKIAHHINISVMVGKQGADERVLKALDESLKSHELVKVRFQNFKDETRPIGEKMALALKATLVATVGHVAIFYRRNEDEKDRVIFIPRSVLE
ncbi:MAG: YhbY family RNA-binding protein [Spirochaetia bacterium]|nr:YhbY family RNA-binding protein [Spirochaetia bacterium]